MKDIATKVLLQELYSRGIFTTARNVEEILSSGKGVKLIPTYGKPTEKQQCRSCLKILNPEHFIYYQARVTASGYLQRSNAVCKDCTKKENKERQYAFDNSVIPAMPKPGSTCPHCKRKWFKKWHRHHVGDKFIDWLCGHCNMSFSDHRNKNVKR